MREVFPGAVVYISAVTTGCPCHDGTGCTEQVWSVAFQGVASSELALSRIDGKWQIGPLQRWWLTRDRIVALFAPRQLTSREERQIAVDEFVRRLDEHNLAFPYCAPVVESDDV